MTTIENIAKSRMLVILASVLFFTSNFPLLSIGPVSFSFFAGLILLLFIYTKHHQLLRSNKDSRLLWAFCIISIIGEILTPLSIEWKSLFTCAQIVYWYTLAIVFSNIYAIVYTKLFSKCVLIILICIFAFFIKFPLGNDAITENFTSFIVISIWPFVLLYWNKALTKILYILFVLFILLIVGSRTGILVVLVQIIAILIIKYISSKNLIITAICFFCIGIISSNDNFRLKIAETVFPDDSGMQMVIVNPEMIFQMDKSWVQRRLQQEKCKQVFVKHPILGVGALNVQRYRIDIDISNLQNIDENILRFELMHSDQRSAHNAYFQLIAENGIFSIILIIVLYRLIKKIYIKRDEGDEYIFVITSLIGVLLNLFMLSAIWGTNTWILLGLYLGFANSSNNKAHIGGTFKGKQL